MDREAVVMFAKVMASVVRAMGWQEENKICAAQGKPLPYGDQIFECEAATILEAVGIPAYDELERVS